MVLATPNSITGLNVIFNDISSMLWPHLNGIRVCDGIDGADNHDSRMLLCQSSLCYTMYQAMRRIPPP